MVKVGHRKPSIKPIIFSRLISSDKADANFSGCAQRRPRFLQIGFGPHGAILCTFNERKKRENLFMIQHFSRLNFDGIVRQMRAEPSSASFTVFAREAEILS